MKPLQIAAYCGAVPEKSPPSLFAFTALNGLPIGLALSVSFLQQPPLLLGSSACAVVVLVVAYRVMRACPGPWSRALVLYGALVLLLIVLGMGMSWAERVGDNPAGSWLARLDGGLRVAILGHVALVVVYPLVLFANAQLGWPNRIVQS